MTADLVTITNGKLSAAINPLGAELWSLTNAAGAEYLTDADPAFWGGHAPLLFPIVGSLADETFRHKGAAYALPRHGFARRSLFAAQVQEDRALFRLTDSPETHAAYPFAFVLEMAFALEDATLRMEATVRNPGAEVLPFSFGYHPAFAWPLPGGIDKGGPPKAAHRLVFAQEEPQPVRRVSKGAGLILPQGEPTPVRGRDLPLDSALFEADALIWDRLNSRALAYGAHGGAWLDIAFPDTPQLGVWQVPGARYICIEPWAGHADPEGFAGEISDKPGIELLPPGDARSFRMDVTLRPPA